MRIWKRNTRYVVQPVVCIYAYLITLHHSNQATKLELKNLKEEFQRFEQEMESL